MVKKKSAKKVNKDRGQRQNLKEKNTKINSESLLVEINERAYEIFVKRGFEEGKDLDHWLQAEKEVKNKHEIV